MKKIVLSAMFLFVMFSCQMDSKERYTRTSPEIDLLKKGIEYYENADWDKWAEQYADSAKIYQNTWDVWSSPEVTKERHIDLISKLSNYGFKKEDMIMERIIDDKGKIWVNSWALWRGTLKANNKVIEIPVHLTIQFVNGKIVEECGFWNTAALNEELKNIERTAFNDN